MAIETIGTMLVLHEAARDENNDVYLEAGKIQVIERELSDNTTPGLWVTRVTVRVMQDGVRSFNVKESARDIAQAKADALTPKPITN